MNIVGTKEAFLAQLRPNNRALAESIFAGETIDGLKAREMRQLIKTYYQPGYEEPLSPRKLAGDCKTCGVLPVKK